MPSSSNVSVCTLY